MAVESIHPQLIILLTVYHNMPSGKTGKILNGGQHKMLKISHLPRIMIRMKRKGKAAVGGRVYQRSVCRYHEAKYPTRPDIRDDASIVPYRLHLGSYRKYMSLREGTLLSKIVLRAMFVITESFLAG